MTVRTATMRPGTPLLVVLLAVLVHTTLAPILACQVAASEQPVATVAAVTASVRETAECPGCLLEPTTDDGGSEATRATTDVAVSPESAGPCTTDRPCQHGPGGGHPGGDTAVRGLDTPRDGGPPPTPAGISAPQVDRPVLPDSASGPVPPAAVLAPVAVLCVDRN